MSDDFIPFNQSTPMQGKWQDRRQSQNQNQMRYQNNRYQNGNRRGGHNNRWGNNSQRNSSFGSDSNSSFTRDNRNNIDAYLHPSMLQDPWEQLRKAIQSTQQE